MALLGNIRRKTGLLLTVIAVGIGLFLLQDFLQSTTSFMGAHTNDVGVIDGQSIDYKVYDDEFQRLVAEYEFSQGKKADESTTQQLREQAWRKLITKYALQSEFDELGIQVTRDDEESEQVDMVQGVTIHNYVTSQFTNPETGEYDKSSLIGFLNNLAEGGENQQAAEMRIRWELFEREMLEERLRSKYEDLISKTNYVTTEEAKREFKKGNTKAKTEFLYVPFYSIPDSLVNLTEADYKSYFEANKSDYKNTQHGRTLEYITFAIEASDKDRNRIQEEITRIRDDFEKRTDDSIYARLKSDNPSSLATYKLNELPMQIRNAPLEQGKVYGPFREGEKFVLYKVVNNNLSDTVMNAKASHILLKTEGEDIDEQRAQAESLLKRALEGEDFAALASEYSQDPGSGANGGDLGEFGKGMMVKPFENAVFNAKKKGVVNELIETQFGFHIINVTELAKISSIDNKFKIAKIEKGIYPGRETKDKIFREASIIHSKCKTLEDLRAFVEADSNITMMTAKNIRPTATTINSLQKARPIVQWAYRDAEIGDVSKLVELEKNYVIAALVDKMEEGDAKYEDVKEQVDLKAKNKAKGEIVIKKIAAERDLERTKALLNETYGSSFAKIDKADVDMNSYSIGGIGSDPVAIGTIFGMKEGQVSKPTIGESSVWMIKVIEISEPAEAESLEDEKEKLLNNISNRDNYMIDQVVRKKRVEEDNRYKFY